MDFFAAQEQARKKTRLLALWFALAVLCIAALAHLFAMLVFHMGYSVELEFGFMSLIMMFFSFFIRLFFVLVILVATYMFFRFAAKTWQAEPSLVFMVGVAYLIMLILWIILIYVLSDLFTITKAGLADTVAHAGLLQLSETEMLEILFLNYFSLWDNPFVFCFSLLIGVGIVAASLYKIRQISRQGGALIAEQLGGCMIARDTSNLAEKQLLNVLDEMAIAAGIPAPVVFVLAAEPGLNAFAAGLSTQDSVIAVTQGLLNTMNRDELQGIIAHEISHIVNGDTRLNLKLIGILFGINGVSLSGRTMMKFSGGINWLALAAGSALCVIGSIGLCFGRMIQSAASREREYLADAAAVQFTRNPAGLISALNKLRASGSRIQHPQAIAASHLFFAASEKTSLFLAFLTTLFDIQFATHPPLEERIQRLGGEALPLSEIDLGMVEKNRAQVPAAKRRVSASKRRVALPAMFFAVAAGDGIAGDIAPKSVANAQTLLASLATLREEASTTAGATHIVCGIFCYFYFPSRHVLPFADLWDEDEQDSFEPPHFMSRLEEWIPPEILAAAWKVCRWLNTRRERGARWEDGACYSLVLLDIALPTLRGASEEERRQLLDWVKVFMFPDGYQVNPSQFALYSILQNTLLPPVMREAASGRFRKGQLDRDVARLLSLIAHAGHEDEEDVAVAYEAAMEVSPVDEQLPFRKDFSLKTLSPSFSRLALTEPLYRKKLLEACAVAVQHDGMITPVENELLRAFAQSLDCPAPLVALPSANP